MQQVEHIGIAVNQLSISVPLFEKLLNCQCYKKEEVSTEKVNNAFLRMGDTKIELFESTDTNGVIVIFIQSRGEGIHLSLCC
jgi:methylmalonyl-CoA/ethylmalonyl-CoA epimerase